MLHINYVFRLIAYFLFSCFTFFVKKIFLRCETTTKIRALPENIALVLQRRRKLGRYFDRGQYFPVKRGYHCIIVDHLKCFERCI